jgi:cytochrome c oxidase subunit 1
MTATLPPEVSTVEVTQKRWAKWMLYLGFVGFLLGLLMGGLQAMDRADFYLYDDFLLANYYQGLTLHGVSMAFILTFAFANSFLTLSVMRGFKRPMASTALIQGSFFLALAGVVLAGASILLNRATVLFTFYSPMEPSVFFYIGAVLLVVSTWVVLLNQLLTLRLWRKEHPGEKSPLLAFISIITYIMWFIASLGVAVEVLVFLIPWSLGLVDGTDPLLNRTLFWFTGHPIVYFWLLPAYVSWYMSVPKQVGGRLYSDAVVRGVFILFLLLSTPVGLHHQFTDPGVDEGLKLVHGVFTFGVFFPSLVTAFTLLASFEDAAKRKGGGGLITWVTKLPWGNPSVVAQLLAMLGFVLGGISGLVNASATVNLVVHNTSFIPGHFHLTVGTAVALTIMGVAYWLVPYLTGKELWGRRIALWQAWLWIIGVSMFSFGLMRAGVEGQPRRVPVSLMPEAYLEDSWAFWDMLAAVGGSIMFISGVLFFVVMIGTWLRKKSPEGEATEFPVAECIHPKSQTPAILDRIGLWTVVGIVLIAIAYIPVFLTHNYEFTSRGFYLWGP